VMDRSLPLLLDFFFFFFLGFWQAFRSVDGDPDGLREFFCRPISRARFSFAPRVLYLRHEVLPWLPPLMILVSRRPSIFPSIQAIDAQEYPACLLKSANSSATRVGVIIIVPFPTLSFSTSTPWTSPLLSLSFLFALFRPRNSVVFLRCLTYTS